MGGRTQDAVALYGVVFSPAHGVDDLSKSLLHMCGLPPLMLGPLPMEAQHGNPPLVLDLRIDFAEGLIVGDHLAAAVEPNEGSVVTANFLFEFRSVCRP